MKKNFENIFNYVKKFFVGDSAIWFVFFAICIFSIIEYYSASSQHVFNPTRSGLQPITEHILFLFAGLVIMLVIVRFIPVKLIRILGYLGLIASFGLLIGMTFFHLGVTADGATRGIPVFSLFQFQPLELAKLSLVIVAADMLSMINNPQKDNTKISQLLRNIAIDDEAKIFWLLMGISIIICGLIFKDGLSSSALLFATVIILCIIQNISWKRIGLVLLSIFSVVAIIFLIEWYAPNVLPNALSRASTWVNRVKGFTDTEGVQGKNIDTKKDYISQNGDTINYTTLYKYYYDVKSKKDSVIYQIYDGEIRYNINNKYHYKKDENGKKYLLDKNGDKIKERDMRTIRNTQGMHSKIAIARGAIGTFPGNSIQRDYLPKVESDFIYAIIIEETGAIGGFFVMLLYFILLYYAGMIARSSSDVFPAMLAFGASLIIVIQALVHMFVVVDVGFVTGQPLPLFSQGGTSIIITSTFFGILLRVTLEIKEERLKNNIAAQTIDDDDYADNDDNEIEIIG